MGRSLTIAVVLAASLASAGCGFVEHLLGVPEAAPPLGESILNDAGSLVDRGLIGGYPPPAGQCMPSETDQTCDDTGNGHANAVAVEQLAGIWVEAEYGSTAIHIDSDGWIRQVDLAAVIAGEPLPAGIPQRLYNAGQVSASADGYVTIETSLSVPGYSASGQATGYLDSSLNAIFGITLQGEMTVLGQTSDLYLPSIVLLRWDPETGTFPFMETLPEYEVTEDAAQ